MKILMGNKGLDGCDLRTATTFTGHRILLVDVCTNFVHSEVEAFVGYAFGGNNYTIPKDQ